MWPTLVLYWICLLWSYELCFIQKYSLDIILQRWSEVFIHSYDWHQSFTIIVSWKDNCRQINSSSSSHSTASVCAFSLLAITAIGSLCLLEVILKGRMLFIWVDSGTVWVGTFSWARALCCPVCFFKIVCEAKYKWPTLQSRSNKLVIIWLYFENSCWSWHNVIKFESLCYNQGRTFMRICIFLKLWVHQLFGWLGLEEGKNLEGKTLKYELRALSQHFMSWYLTIWVKYWLVRTWLSNHTWSLYL